MNFQNTEAVDTVLDLRRWGADTMYRVTPAEAEATSHLKFTTSPRAIRDILDLHRSTPDLEVGSNFPMRDTTTFEGSCTNIFWWHGRWGHGFGFHLLIPIDVQIEVFWWSALCARLRIMFRWSMSGDFGEVTSATCSKLFRRLSQDPSDGPLHTSKFPSFTSHSEPAPGSNLFPRGRTAFYPFRSLGPK